MPISISLSQHAFSPGETVSVNVSLDSSTTKIPKYIMVRLKWFTEGEGDHAIQVITEERITAPHISEIYSFNFILPLFPWSYEGKLFSIKWCIEAAPDKGVTEKIVIVNAPHGEIVRVQKKTPQQNHRF